MEEIYGIPSEPIVYYDKEIKDCHYCKLCGDIIPLSKKDIGLCDDCEPSSFEESSISEARQKFLKM